MNIELREPRPRSETFVLTALRIGVGLLIVLHGVVRIIEPIANYQLLFGSRLSVMDESTIATLYVVHLLWIGGEFLAGCGLIFGLMTRLSAIAAAGFAIVQTYLAYLDYGLSLYQFAAYEPSLLLLVIALFFLVMGGGSFSADHGLHERARIRAIQRDDIWLQPPYISAPDTRENRVANDAVL